MKKIFALFILAFSICSHAVSFDVEEAQTFVKVEMKVTKGGQSISDSVVLHTSYAYPADAPPTPLNTPIGVFAQKNTKLPKIQVLRNKDLLAFQIQDKNVPNWKQELSKTIYIQPTIRDQNVKLGPYILEYRIVEYKG